ncbi:MAG TPA: hypothetical protein VKU01_21195 [Bryobacteraceae bacterium]|nr:hypothetical protein [Bryobacteraceae bacterium]
MLRLFPHPAPMNTHTKILAWIHTVLGAGLTVAGVAIVIGVQLSKPERPDTVPFLIGLFACLWIGFVLPALVGGVALLMGKGWARVVVLLVSFEFLFAFPVGTVLGVYGFYAILKAGSPKPILRSAGAHVRIPPLTPTCQHLQSIEQAIRAAGIEFTASGTAAPKAQCRIHRRSFVRQFAPLEPVTYLEYFIAERSPEDIPVAALECRQCSCRIEVLHPAECNLKTRWFPEAPAPMVLLAEKPFASRSDITSIAPSPTGRFAAIAAGIHNTAQELAIWDVAKHKPVRSMAAHGVIRNMAWSNDERTLVTARGVLWTQGPSSAGPSLFVWDTANGTQIRNFGWEVFGVRGVALSGNGLLILASGMLGETTDRGSTLDLWDSATGRLLTRLACVDGPIRGTMPFFTSVAFSPDGALAIAACDIYVIAMSPSDQAKDQRELPWWWSRGVRIWRLADGQELDLVRPGAPVREVSISQDGTRLLTSGRRFGVWNLTNGSMLWDKANYYADGAAASADGSVVARGVGERVDNHGPYENTGVELYDGSSGELLTSGLHRVTPTAMAFANGTLIAGGVEGELRFWNWRTTSS